MAVGDTRKIRMRNRIVTFKQVAESGIGMWRIISNVPAKGSKLSKVI